HHPPRRARHGCRLRRCRPHHGLQPWRVRCRRITGGSAQEPGGQPHLSWTEARVTLLALDDVHTYYGDSYVLQGVNLDVPEHSVIGLLGRNGVGKTTTIRSIAGFTAPRRGAISLAGENIAGLPPYRI